MTEMETRMAAFHFCLFSWMTAFNIHDYGDEDLRLGRMA